jgi:hemin uptake protein HemP
MREPEENEDARRATPPVWPIETLVGPGREALIRHGEHVYRLRITAQNRLILTK